MTRSAIRRLLAASILMLATLVPTASSACHESGEGCPGCKHECSSESRGCEVPGSANGFGDTLAPVARATCG